MQEYECGTPKYPVKEIGTSITNGTLTTFLPDNTIFIESVYKWDILANRLRELSFLNAGITLTLTDKRVLNEDGTFRSEVFHSTEGLKEFVEYIDEAREPLIENIIHISTEKNGTPVEIAMTYNTSYNENVHSYVNNINTIEGGTHLAGFRRGLTRTLKKYAEDSKMLEKLKIEISGDDFREGLLLLFPLKFRNLSLKVRLKPNWVTTK
jgi:DNA gyrase subunit B